MTISVTDFKLNNNNKENIEKKAKEYQEVFVQKMLNIVFENVKIDPFSEKESLFKSLLIDEYGKYLAPLIEIDKKITKHLLSVQEVENEQR